MGLFKSLFNSVTSNLEKTVKNNLDEKVREKFNDFVGSPATNTRGNTFARQNTQHIDIHYFANILKDAFGGYSIQENVTVEQMGWYGEKVAIDREGAYPCRPYDFVLYKYGQPVGIIMVSEHNTDALAKFKNAKETANRNNVPFINFFTHFPNERNYVINRIQTAIM